MLPFPEGHLRREVAGLLPQAAICCVCAPDFSVLALWVRMGLHGFGTPRSRVSRVLDSGLGSVPWMSF